MRALADSGAFLAPHKLALGTSRRQALPPCPKPPPKRSPEFAAPTT